jgi:hypothetical protein
MNSANLLPPGFAALEPFANSWALAGAASRSDRRLNSSETERVAFFNAAKDLVPAGLDYLDGKPIDRFDDQEQRLMNLLLTFCHVALAVEIQADDEPKHAAVRQYITITKASADMR